MTWVPIIIGTAALLFWSCGPKVKTERYPDGQVKTRYHYYNNQANEFIKHGPYTTYHSNGKPKEKGSYKENAKDGNILYYFLFVEVLYTIRVSSCNYTQLFPVARELKKNSHQLPYV